MFSSFFKSANQLKPQTLLAKEILDDIYDQSKSQMLSDLKYTRITYSKSLAYEDKLVGILSKSLVAIINFDSLLEMSDDEKKTIKQIIIKKLLKEAQNYDSSCLEISKSIDGWNAWKEIIAYYKKGLSYSRKEIGYDPPYGHYELYEINFPLTLFADSLLLEQQIYTCLENQASKILKADYLEKNDIEMMTIKIK